MDGPVGTLIAMEIIEPSIWRQKPPARAVGRGCTPSGRNKRCLLKLMRKIENVESLCAITQNCLRRALADVP